MEKIEVKECHKYLLQIAKSFHDICIRHGIPYFMVGGTQLGAVRHKGFIPWDDDMDFCVPRKYYKTLIELLDKELPSNYKVRSIYHSKKYCNGFFKIEDTNTLIKEVGEAGLTKGVNIDIFPLDYTNDNKGVFSKNHLISKLIEFETLCFADMEGASRLISFINKLLYPMRLIMSNKAIFNFIDKHLILTEGDYLVNHYGVYAMKEIVPKSFFGIPALYPFEDTELYGVEKFDDYLTHFYKDYMQPPKGTANHFHIEELYKIK